jgi:pyrroline-5-carboxylate reductase
MVQKQHKKEIKMAFIGGGNMAEAMIHGILQAGISRPRQILVTDINRQRLEYCRRKLGVKTSPTNIAACSAGAIVLAVKPQQARQVLSELRHKLPANSLLISLVTGLTTKQIASALDQTLRIIRVVPNTPALVGASASAFYCGNGTSGRDRIFIEKILKSIGTAVCLDEAKLNAITALTGSGPAYVFYLMEALLAAARVIRLPEETAYKLVLATVAGSALLLSETGLYPAELRRRVTSHRGTTEAAIKVLEKAMVKKAFVAAVKAAHKRAGELSSGK